MNALVIYEWTGEAMKPLPNFAKLCDKHFVVGERYKLDSIEERSFVSHRHYFAEVYQAWLNMPEQMTDRFKTPDHLRKFALIKTGYCDERTLVCSSAGEALRVAAFVEPVDEYAIVTITGPVVGIFTAKSQSYKAMGRATFQKSKSDVLEYLASMIGVETSALKEEVAA